MAVQTRHHFQKEDDEKLLELINSIGKNWKEIHSKLPSWTERQLRDRYTNYLQPGINNSNWLPWEDQFLLAKVNQIGHKWSHMTSYFNNRSAVNIKNRYSFLTGSGAKQMRKKRLQDKTLVPSEKSTQQISNLPELNLLNKMQANHISLTDYDEILFMTNSSQFDFDINSSQFDNLKENP